MKIRWKYLTFLTVFLLGSFMIVTWKSYSIFSQKYSKTLQAMELQDLEKQAQYISQQFSGLQKILGDASAVEAQLKALGIDLLAHVINEDGKWKAQWFEGQSGIRKDAQSVTKQIPFDSLSASRKSWHLVQLQDKAQGVAYVIPAVDKNTTTYYAFFLSKSFLHKLFKGQSFLETMMAYSPQIGSVYSNGDFDESIIDKNKSFLKNKQSGVLPMAKQASLFFYFHPDLQLYFFKTQSVSPLKVESPVYLLTLFVMVAFLIGLAVLALDVLMKNLFARVEYVTASLRMRVDTPSVGTHFTDELQELEYITHYLEDGDIKLAPSKINEAPAAQQEQPEASAQANEALLAQIRPKAISSLGYLHRLKAQAPASPHMQLLEKELRELRAIIDPATASAQGLPPTPQPYFNPILDAFNKESILEASKKTEARAENALEVTSLQETAERQLEEAPVEKQLTSEELIKEAREAIGIISSVQIRKPKREGHESNNI